MALRLPIALLAVLLPGYGVQAAETAVLTLSCDGTVTRMIDFNDKPRPVTNMGLLVDLPKGTVTGFAHVARMDAHVARIDHISEVLVDFSGSVWGSIDRITGCVKANDDEYQWDLLCKPAKRLF
jgi:hypothetical protein